MRRGKLIAGFFLLICGMVVDLVGGIFFGLYQSKKSNCTLSVQAMVVDLEYDFKDFDFDDVDFSDAVAPVFCYEVDGEEFTETYHVYTTLNSYHIGDKAELLVDPDDPGDFMLADSIWMQLTAGICIGVGTFLLIIAVILIRSFKRGAAIKKAGSFNYSYQPNSMSYGQPNHQPDYNSYGQSKHTTAQDNTYILNGKEYQSVDIEQEGYYNLNGEVYKSK